MYVITPKTISEAQLVSSSIAEPDTGEALWVAATSYSIGQLVIRTTTHRVYECQIAGVDATLPENATSGLTPRWLDLRATNRWAMFDEYINSQSTATTTVTLGFSLGNVGALAVLNASAGSLRVEVLAGGASGISVYDTTVYMVEGVSGWYDLLFVERSIVDQVVLSDIPLVEDQYIRLTFSGNQVAIGKLVLGTKFELGLAQYDASLGIIDYSRKETDEFGRTSWVSRANSRKASLALWIDNDKLPGIARKLTSLTATPCVWVPSEMPNYAPLLVYGGYKDWSVVVKYFSNSLVNLEVEGVI